MASAHEHQARPHHHAGVDGRGNGPFDPFDTRPFATADDEPHERSKHPAHQHRVDENVGEQNEIEHDQAGVQRDKKVSRVLGGLPSLVSDVVQEQLVEQCGAPPVAWRRQLQVD